MKDHDNVLKEIKKLTDKTLFAPKRITERNKIVEIIKEIQVILLPGYYRYNGLTVDIAFKQLEADLFEEIEAALLFSGKDATKAEELTDSFMEKLPKIQQLLYTDITALYEGDPAAKSKAEVILCYPGFYAISIYRMAHELYVLEIPYIPRIMTEYAHQKTGIDINPGATIGKYFFIDHGTGIVIGETTVIGEHVKIYQGVTLGALSTRGGRRLQNKKRHPTIEDNVTIYSGASILGGETVIGKNSIIGGNVFITDSIAEDTRVSVKNQELRYNMGSCDL